MDRATKRKANERLAELSYGRRYSVGEFVAEARKISYEVSEALDGIWCGRSGRAYGIIDSTCSLVVDWYEGKVEVAYIS
jgi:hypothetical protein